MKKKNIYMYFFMIIHVKNILGILYSYLKFFDQYEKLNYSILTKIFWMLLTYKLLLSNFVYLYICNEFNSEIISILNCGCS